MSSLAPTVAMHGIAGRSGNTVTTSPSERRRRRLALYEDVCDTFTNPGVLTQYLTEKLPDVQARWTVRTEMTKQWAITSMLSYSFFIEQRDPSKYVFAIDRGDVLSLNFRPAYHRETGQLIGMDHVPFRLTPALQHLMTPIGVHGTLAESMMATVSCLHSNLSFIEDYASLYFSGDMIPWHKNHNAAVVARNVQITTQAKRPQPSPPAMTLQKVLNLSQVVDRNVDQVLQRIRDLAPLDAAPEHDRTTCLSRSTPSGDPSCVNQAVHELIKIASNPVHLSRQDVLWQPFF
jgi:phosphatidylinositol kinase/protein kinase (PI-3  family)